MGGHRRIRHSIKKRDIVNNERVFEIVSRYNEYKARNQIDQYLINMGLLLKNNFTFAPERSPNNQPPADN